MTPKERQVMGATWECHDPSEPVKDLLCCLDALDEAETLSESRRHELCAWLSELKKHKERIAELEAALNGRRERIEQLEDELGPLRAFQRNHLPGGCE